MEVAGGTESREEMREIGRQTSNARDEKGIVGGRGATKENVASVSRSRGSGMAMNASETRLTSNRGCGCVGGGGGGDVVGKEKSGASLRSGSGGVWKVE